MRTILIFILFLVFVVLNGYTQSVEIQGKISAAVEVDGIHIINKTASRFSISNADGTFIIPAKLNDTILFSGISYQPKEVVITKFIIASQQMPVYLEELVNALDEVVVGKILTGDLMFDIANADLKPALNFYDIGIPGYTGKVMTQGERRLYAATSGGVIGTVINGISGRTKQLKAQLKMERLDACLDKMKADFSADFFKNYDLEEDKRKEFFYYCQDDPEFEKFCNSKRAMDVLIFLEHKLRAYKAILQEQKQ